MAKLSLTFQEVGGIDWVIRVEDVKWAYQDGSDYFIEFWDKQSQSWLTRAITSGSFAAIDQLLSVTTKKFDAEPIVGTVLINQHAITLANNVGGLDAQILSAGQLAFTGTGGANWTIANDANAATITSGTGVAQIAGVASPTPADQSTITTAVSVVNGESYTFSVPNTGVALGGFVVGTDFDITVAVGATSVTLTPADVVSGNTIRVTHTASSTGSINIVITFVAITASNQTAIDIDFGAPSFRRRTGSTQFPTLDGTLLRYEPAGVQLPLLVSQGVNQLQAATNNALVAFTAVSINGSPWTGGNPVATSMQKYLNVKELTNGNEMISLDSVGILSVETSTAPASLDS